MKKVLQCNEGLHNNDIQHIYIIGAKSIGAYGGYETFVDKLTEYHQNNKRLQYHIVCKANGDGHMDEQKLEGSYKVSNTEFVYHNAQCFKICVPNIGSAQAIYYDLKALDECCKHIKNNHIEHPIVYILACRIGLFASYFQKKIHGFGGKMYINPDGHEFLRGKWNFFIRKYWKFSERLMVKYSDLVICDSKNIESYIHQEYGRYHPATTFIAYGAETKRSSLKEDDAKLLNWYQEKKILPKSYYLIVGRFVPENNFETMINEFMRSESGKDLVIITTTNNALMNQLENRLNLKTDARIKFVGTVYNTELLKKIRENAYGYLHGHEVGGTNPSLLESLGSTDLNLLLDIGFNREVAENTALYWNKEPGNLANLINMADRMDRKEIKLLGSAAKSRISSAYSWEIISERYERVFAGD